MAGGYILSNRLQGFHDRLVSLGDTVLNMRNQRTQEARQAKADAMAQEAHNLETQQGGLRLEALKREDAKAKELAGWQTELSGMEGKPDIEAAHMDRLRARIESAMTGKQISGDEIRTRREMQGLGLQEAKQGLELKTAKEKRDAEAAASQLKTDEAQRNRYNLESKKIQSEIDNLAKGGIDPEKKIAIEQKLMTTYLNQNKPFIDVHDAYSRVLASVKDPSPAGDLALIFNFMKMLDPGSTVREGEFATAENAGSIPSSIINKYNKVINGERLGETRKDFINQSKNLYDSARSNYERNQETFSGLADRYGVSRENVVIPLESRSVTDISSTSGNSGQSKNGITSVSNDAEYDTLPSGAVFIDPNGVKRRKP